MSRKTNGKFDITGVIKDVLEDDSVKFPDMQDVMIKKEHAEALSKIDNAEHLGKILDSMFEHCDISKTAAEYAKKVSQ